MESIKISLRIILNSQHNVIYLTPSLMNALGCSTGRLTISFGNKKLFVQVKKRNDSSNTLFMSRQVANSLAIPFSGSLSAYFKDNEIHIGAVIGILTTNYSGNLNFPFGRRSETQAHYLESGHNEPVCFFTFTPELINWSDQTVEGIFRRWSPKTQRFFWIKRRCALPQAIYDRIPAPRAEQAESIINTKMRLKSILSTKWFNQGYFNKWSLHQRLMEKGRINDFIPETSSSPTTGQVELMLKRHKMVYLKPARGSLGIGIIKITSIP
ncbi:MAG: YheC/YheD family protein, partial [Bacilli bacterium]